jgi:hypothetical protein
MRTLHLENSYWNRIKANQRREQVGLKPNREAVQPYMRMARLYAPPSLSVKIFMQFPAKKSELY